ncbi:hypothetical protein AMAG_01071 [Allomyces macrogynus ATCC 38327]|uniref:N-acetylgalactosaminide beta-1,3-galactosyltransferase n=1 Tax=Allomyces macrogynus (strain ATCC 38327) TaxID=578462 RepID=A0A0L0RXT3_ALLM3|nr:hypothetical protein AMAG_01071 [Allomyces macrogynus ATCC 38327]|eukprot:KNE55148.1 hypothetical protein AMAG_01071 [Allomyces macrogynus ATCC 38327]
MPAASATPSASDPTPRRRPPLLTGLPNNDDQPRRSASARALQAENKTDNTPSILPTSRRSLPSLPLHAVKMPTVAGGRHNYAALHGHEHHHHQQYVPLPPRRWAIVMALIVFGAFLLLEPRHRTDPGGAVPGRVQQDMVRKGAAAVDSDQVVIPASPSPLSALVPLKVAGPAAATTAIAITTSAAPAALSPTDAPTAPPVVHPISPPPAAASAPEIDPTTAARLITQLAPRSEAYDGTSPRLTDPRWDDYVVAIHSGLGTAAERVPVQLSTFLQGVRHIVLLGDTNDVEIAGFQMVDVVRGGQYIRDAEDRIQQQESSLGKRSVPDPDESVPAANANTTSKLTKRDDARLREHVPNQNSDGWRGDAHKFIPGALAMYDKYPHAKWYLILDDDTYMFMENLHLILAHLDGDQVYYFGKYYPSGGCPGGVVWPDGPVFAHGGGGIVMSRAALTQMLGVADSCIVKYRDCFAGDIRLAQCMRDAGIKFHATVAPDLFHNVAPHVANFGGYEQGTACRRVVSFHHLTPHAMMRLYAADRDAHRAAIERINAGKGPDQVPIHWVPRTAEGKARQAALQAHAPQIGNLPSTFYAPVTQADVFRRIVEADVGEFDYQVRRHAPAGKKITPCRMPSEGRAACEADQTCASWDYSPLDQACYLSEGVRKTEPALGFSSGVIRGRYRCETAVW